VFLVTNRSTSASEIRIVRPHRITLRFLRWNTQSLRVLSESRSRSATSGIVNNLNELWLLPIKVCTFPARRNTACIHLVLLISLMVNMNIALDYKLPLSPYSMFSVLFTGGGKKHKADVALPVQVPLIGTCILGGQLVGMYGSPQSAYNPFDLYGQARAGRNNPLPPHLVFAELGNDEAACAYLNAYGALHSEYTTLNQQTRTEWRKLSTKTPDPQSYFRYSLGKDAMLPPRPQQGIAFYEVSRKRFWELHKEYETTLRLVAAFERKGQESTAIAIRQALIRAGVKWHLRTDREFIEKATGYIRRTINAYLDEMSLGSCEALIAGVSKAFGDAIPSCKRFI